MFLTKFDVFPKFSDRSVQMRTALGGVLTILTSLWVVILLISRFSLVFRPPVTNSIVIDDDPADSLPKVFINFDISIKSPCTMLHLDLFEDTAGERLDIIENITRKRLDSSGVTIEESMMSKKAKKLNVSYPPDYCGPCYGALPQSSCCNSCKDVMDAFKKKKWSFFGADRWEQCVKEGYTNFGAETCSIAGSLKIKRGSGRFHFGLGANSHDSSKLHSHDISSVLSTHSINHSIRLFEMGSKIPTFTPPLNGVNVALPLTNDSLWSANYFLHIVPSNVYLTNRRKVQSFQYSVMYSQNEISNSSAKRMPGIFFEYDFSPMMVVSSLMRPSMLAILKEVGGIIGGAFCFSMIIDSLMYGALSTIEGKRSIGKIF